MAGHALPSGRLQDLLAGEAVGDLSLEESVDLTALLGTDQTDGRDDFMMAAGLAQIAFLKADRRGLDRLPGDLEARLMAQAAGWSATSSRPNAVTDIGTARRTRQAAPRTAPGAGTARRLFSMSATGWYVAAALAIAFAVFRTDAPMTRAPITAEDQRAALIRSAGDLVTVPWSRSDQPGYADVKGDVVWSSARQEGYLRLAGLPVNDPQRSQYQLWIVDPGRDTHPVDGGIFNVTSADEVTIPIQAKLGVGGPTAFAITLEQPGGVVVSDGPLLIVAAVGG